MRLVVTGKKGQLVRALQAQAATEFSFSDTRIDVVALGRPQLDLSLPETICPALRNARPDVIVSAAAYTDVDGAECDVSSASRINVMGAGTVAASAAALNVPIIHLSTDYVFGGDLGRPYREDDWTKPCNQYGISKLAGERAVLATSENSVVLRTAWLVSSYGENFAKAILAKASGLEQISVVEDQLGNPTMAGDLAGAILRIAEALLAAPRHRDLRGVFHLCGADGADRATFSQEILQASARCGGPVASLKPIVTLPSASHAPRPANSQMSCQKIKDVYGITLPGWARSLDQVVRELCLTNSLHSSRFDQAKTHLSLPS